MRINYKQQELIDFLFNKVKKEYPEIKLLNIESSPDDPEHIWINVEANMDEDREIELKHYSSELEADILINYGYAISIMPENAYAIY